MPKKLTALERLERQVNEQRDWIERHGQTLSGYVLHYGGKEDPEHFGDGGEAIYKADKDALDAMEADLGRARARVRR